MRNRLLSVVIVFIFAVSLLAGCSGSFVALSDGPAVNDAVTSNGGLSVRKGDYLYFVNGFISSEGLVSGDNEYNSEENSAIYRAELDANGELMTDDEGELINIELLIPKIVGFENGGFYIFDDYIYYVTPTILKDSTGTIRFDLVDFYRAKLDGSAVEKIYATDNYTEGSFSAIKIDSQVYFLIFDGASVIKVNANTGAETIIVEEVSNVVFPNVTNYNADNNTLSNEEKYIYYSRPLNEADNVVVETGNVLAKMLIATGVEEILMQDSIWTYAPYLMFDGKLYYTKFEANSLNSKTYVRAIDSGVFITNSETQLVGTYYDKVLPVATGNLVVAVLNSNLVLVSNVLADDGIELLVDENVTLLFTNGDYAYYTYGEDDTLARINVLSKVTNDLSDEEDVVEVASVGTLNYDFDGEYVYYYVTFTNDNGTSIYLKRVQVSGTVFESEFIGVLETDDLPDEEETETVE